MEHQIYPDDDPYDDLICREKLSSPLSDHQDDYYFRKYGTSSRYHLVREIHGNSLCGRTFLPNMIEARTFDQIDLRKALFCNFCTKRENLIELYNLNRKNIIQSFDNQKKIRRQKIRDHYSRKKEIQRRKDRDRYRRKKEIQRRKDRDRYRRKKIEEQFELVQQKRRKERSNSLTIFSDDGEDGDIDEDKTVYNYRCNHQAISDKGENDLTFFQGNKDLIFSDKIFVIEEEKSKDHKTKLCDHCYEPLMEKDTILFATNFDTQNMIHNHCFENAFFYQQNAEFASELFFYPRYMFDDHYDSELMEISSTVAVIDKDELSYLNDLDII